MTVQLNIDALTMLAAVGSMIITGLIFYFQHKQHKHENAIASTNYKLALFEERVKYFETLSEAFLDMSLSDGEYAALAHKIGPSADRMRFVFGAEIEDFTDSVWQKALDHDAYAMSFSALQDKLRAVPESVTKKEMDTMQQHYDEAMKARNWLFEEGKRANLIKRFEPYLKLPTSIKE
ncbi:hypothetical protein [Falsiruegeria mediterranea]|uniref:hypothetical protein n=1 Tax=Falsiruegeria mediterranea TaxID=1280832 RepID=UPI0015F28905|nr:hypothetical protein [Falsiruegeria mediterranea]